MAIYGHSLNQFDTGVPTYAATTNFGNAAPTSTHFNVGSYSGVNGRSNVNDGFYIAMLVRQCK